MLSKCLVDFQLLLATSVKGLMSPVTWQQEGWSLPGFDAWSVFLFEIHSPCVQWREGRLLVCAGLLHLQQCSVPALCCPVPRREQDCPKLQQKSSVPDFPGDSLYCPGLCPGGQGRAAVTGGRAGLKKLELGCGQ